jgi:hypothetical protein
MSTRLSTKSPVARSTGSAASAGFRARGTECEGCSSPASGSLRLSRSTKSAASASVIGGGDRRSAAFWGDKVFAWPHTAWFAAGGLSAFGSVPCTSTVGRIVTAPRSAGVSSWGGGVSLGAGLGGAGFGFRGLMGGGSGVWRRRSASAQRVNMRMRPGVASEMATPLGNCCWRS